VAQQLDLESMETKYFVDYPGVRRAVSVGSAALETVVEVSSAARAVWPVAATARLSAN
jgi:hypothetical protein